MHYGVRRDSGRIDLDEVRALALRERPRVIFCGGTAIPRLIDFEGFAAIAAECGAVLAADIAHIAGLVAGGAHPSPVGHADVITTTTHKTLRGPRGAMVMSSARYAEAVERAVFPGLQGGPHDHTTAAIAVALHEASTPAFADYAHRIVANARALAEALLERGFELVSGGTDNHLILIDLTNKGVSGRPAAQALDRAGIVTNRNAIPFDPRKPMDPSGLRIGTPAVTTRGMGAAEMRTIAGWIDEGITGDDATLARIRGEVLELTAALPGSRDERGFRLSQRCWAASGEASQNSSIFVASPWSSLRETAHSSTGSSPSLRCERGVLGRDAHRGGRAHRPDLVAEAHGQHAAGDEVELLHLVVEVAGALLEVRVRRHADQGRRELLGAQRLGQPPELAGHVGARVGVASVVRVHDRVVSHPSPPPAGSRDPLPACRARCS